MTAGILVVVKTQHPITAEPIYGYSNIIPTWHPAFARKGL